MPAMTSRGDDANRGARPRAETRLSAPFGYLYPREAAQAARVSHTTLYVLLAQGEIESIREGAHRLVSIRSIALYNGRRDRSSTICQESDEGYPHSVRNRTTEIEPTPKSGSDQNDLSPIRTLSDDCQGVGSVPAAGRIGRGIRDAYSVPVDPYSFARGPLLTEDQLFAAYGIVLPEDLASDGQDDDR